MIKKIRKIGKDFETRSECNLKKAGQIKYAQHPSTEILCLAYRSKKKIKGKRIKGIITYGRFDWALVQQDHPEFANSILFRRYIYTAWNASFEQAIYEEILVKRHGWPAIDPRRWRCTAAKGASHALPRALDNAGFAIGASKQKDQEGHRLMMKMCKPRPTWNKTKTGPKWYDDVKDLERLYKYCMKDVIAESEIDDMIPDLSPYEQEVWFLDQRINKRGVRVDVPTVNLILGMIDEETKRLKRKVQEESYGLLDSTAQRDKLIRFLQAEGVKKLENLQAKTVDDLLASGKLSDKAEVMLTLRKALGKTSTAKYKAFVEATCDDGYARDLLLYWGASTGRWSGKKIQIQNFPRGLINNIDRAIKIVQTGDTELIKLCYGDLMPVFSSILRGMILSSKGKELFGIDYAAIEARILFWVAGCEIGLKMYRNGEDLYCYQASDIFGFEVNKDDHKFERFVGKECVLGSGFGLGPDRYLVSCHNKGATKVTIKLARKAIKSYRTKFKEVPQLWKNLERAAIMAVGNKKEGKRFTTNKITFYCEGRFLYAELPSGRRLAYCDPRVAIEETPWGEEKPVLYHWGVNPKTRKWTEQKTWGGILTENCVQAISRDLTADAMMRFDDLGVDTLFTVHDELVPEADKDKYSVREMEKILETGPKWAKGIPIKAEGFKNDRYRK